MSESNFTKEDTATMHTAIQSKRSDKSKLLTSITFLTYSFSITIEEN
ncbi:MAG: hypothetical protein IKY69_06525 [Bacteroidaceae bacterium]|nr:hypothetical protein [Bacteroidaceae bacterium]